MQGTVWLGRALCRCCCRRARYLASPALARATCWFATRHRSLPATFSRTVELYRAWATPITHCLWYYRRDLYCIWDACLKLLLPAPPSLLLYTAPRYHRRGDGKERLRGGALLCGVRRRGGARGWFSALALRAVPACGTPFCCTSAAGNMVRVLRAGEGLFWRRTGIGSSGALHPLFPDLPKDIRAAILCRLLFSYLISLCLYAPRAVRGCCVCGPEKRRLSGVLGERAKYAGGVATLGRLLWRYFPRRGAAPLFCSAQTRRKCAFAGGEHGISGQNVFVQDRTLMAALFATIRK